MAPRTPAQELAERFVRAQSDKTRIWGRYEDIYRLTMPQRHLQHQTQPADSLDEIYDATAIQALDDFVSDVLNAFTPPFTNEWIAFEPSRHLQLDAAGERQLRAAIAAYKDRLWQEIEASNLAEAARECYRDLAAGTCALMITSPHPVEPIRCECIPVSDLWLSRGPGGTVGGLFRRFRPQRDHLRVLWPQAAVPPHLDRLPPEAELDVTEGMWRLYDRPGTERHRYIVSAGPDVLVDTVYEGEGGCPIIVTRWDGDPTTAWGTGPLYSALPDIKTLNKAVELTLRHAGKVIAPPTSYTDDGVIDISQGIGEDDWLPRAPGSDPPMPLEPKGRFDIGFLLEDRLRDAVKRALYQNRPEQRGLTPPTATQWLDMAQDLARRMGAPAGSLVHNWQFPIIRRFARLAAERDPAFPRVKFDGGVVALRPTSALVMSQEQEQLSRAWDTAAKLSQLAGPQMAGLIIDFQALGAAAERVGNLQGFRMIRSPEQIQVMMQSAMQAASAAGALPGPNGAARAA